MQLPWIAKALSFQMLRLCPRSVHEFLSMHLTGRGVRVVERHLSDAERHLEHLSRHVDPERDQVVEFGAGRDLFTNLFLARNGYRKQLVVDIEPLARADAVNALLVQEPFKGLCEPVSDGFVVELRRLGIDYRAPFDMRRSGLPTESIGAVISTDTLEHIPADDVAHILKECHRVLRPGGVCSFLIDYSDHYCHSDRNIGNYNFLRFSDRTWRLFSPPNHFQNRLRHRVFVEMFRDIGFELLVNEPQRDSNWEDDVRSLRLAEEFRPYSISDLSWTSAWFLLRKA